MNIPDLYKGTFITTTKGLEKYEAAEARKYCRAHISKQYSETDQLNVLMAGDQAEIDKMRNFIDACRAWSNQADPQLTELQAIQP